MIQETQIIKLNSLKSSIRSLFQNLATKYKSSKDYDVTVIVKQSEQILTEVTNNESHKIQSPKKSNTVLFKENPLILKQQLSHSYISLDEKVSYNQFKTDHSIEELNDLPKLSHKIKFKRKDQKQNLSNDLKIKTSTFAQTEQNLLQLTQSSKKHLNTGVRIQDSIASSSRYSFKINNIENKTQNSDDDDSQAADGQDGGFLIQNYLNHALQYIQKDRMQQLQDFLYKFKEKHNFINLRAQTKWSLLMGYCKQMKLQYERAATNYSQVLTAISQNSIMLSIEIADIYCRLGRCYFQIRQWNKAIGAYSESLNIYKKNKKCLQYANCITNLGVLYLQIGYFIEAQNCFLMAFNIRRFENDKKDKKSHTNLLQTYYHLFDCNLKLKNLKQCQQLLGNISSIIEQAQNHINDLHKIRYFSRCGKLLFYEGKFEYAQNYYQHALDLLKKRENNIQQHAEVLQLMGMLKQQFQDYESSRFYYEKAYHSLQKCVPIQSVKLEIFKKKISYLTDVINKNRSNFKLKLNKNATCHKNFLKDTNTKMKIKRNSTEKNLRQKYNT